MNRKIIGYGSLLNATGWNKTLSREITEKDMSLIKVKDYKRTWSAFVPLKFGEEIIEGCFLDITEEKDSFFYGVGINLTEEEFEDIKLREKGYMYINVTSKIDNPEKDTMYYTAFFPNKNPKDKSNTFVPERYIKMVEKAIEDADKQLKDTFHATTEPFSYPIKTGEYKFEDKEQNLKAGYKN